jgi:hypothetical protein
MPTVGAHIVTHDGDTLGTVGEVRDGHFRVRPLASPDYWLQIIHVSSATVGVVNLTFPAGALPNYTVNEPQAS